MSGSAEEWYLRLPSFGRTLLANAAGLQLRWRRYGPGFAPVVQEILARESFTSEDWEDLQRRRLGEVLTRALAQVPHYRALGERLGLRAVPEELQRWPILEKATLRTDGDALLADDVRGRSLVRVSTSGTTGTPVSVRRSGATERLWYAMFEARVRNRFGVTWKDRWAIMSGRVVVPYERTRPPFWVVNRPMRQLYLSVYHLSERFGRDYVRALHSFRPAYLLGYPSALHLLAGFVLESGRTLPPLKVVITNAEPLFPHQRAEMELAFQCPVVETYGMTEMAAMASGCRAGRMHWWPDFALVELVDDAGEPVAPGEVGQVVGTSLLNLEQPLIRYRTGDLAVAAESGFTCPCGSGAPVLQRVEGRSVDTVVTLDGRRVGAADTFVDLDLNVKETQLVQEGPGRFLVRYVPAGGSPPSVDRVARALRARVGECVVRLESVERIPRTAGGKMRSVIAPREV
jgi:phenylacetate-CoA ligase